MKDKRKIGFSYFTQNGRTRLEAEHAPGEDLQPYVGVLKCTYLLLWSGMSLRDRSELPLR